MKPILEELFYGQFFPFERIVPQDPGYRPLNRKSRPSPATLCWIMGRLKTAQNRKSQSLARETGEGIDRLMKLRDKHSWKIA